jgi:hypothetical protein
VGLRAILDTVVRRKIPSPPPPGLETPVMHLVAQRCAAELHQFINTMSICGKYEV